MNGFVQLPDELFLYIASFLGVQDILSLRKTCNALYQSTKTASLWIDALHRQQAYLPLPRGARSSDDLSIHSSAELESFALNACKAEKDWSLLRGDVPQSLEKRSDSIIYIELFLGRWLVAVYCMSIMGVYDIERPSGEDKLCAGMELRGGMCTSAMACLDVGEHAILITITGSYRTSIFRVALNKTEKLRFEEVITTQVSPIEVIRALDPASHLAAFSRSNFIDVLDWSTHKWLTIPTNSEELDELTYQWNGIIGIRFCLNSVLCVKARSIELYPLPGPLAVHFYDPPFHDSRTHRPTYDLQSARQFLPETTFRGVSISLVKLNPHSSTCATTHVIAYDVLKGLFHFRITVNIRDPSDEVDATSTAPLLFTELIGVHNMMRDHSPYPRFDASHNPSLDSLLQNGRHPAITRGFVSACCLGPEGIRGLWIERTRNSTKRAVVAFSVDLSQLNPIPVQDAFPTLDGVGGENYAPQDDGDSNSEDSVTTVAASVPWMDVRHIEGHPVFIVNSYDLREDLTHCTFSEVSGRIVVGTRDGSLQLL